MKTISAFRFASILAIVAATIPALAGRTALASGIHPGGHGHDHRGAMSIGEPGHPDRVDRTVTVRMGDNFFEPESLEVTPGETIRFVIENSGEYLHEFGIGTPAMHAEHQKEMAAMAEHGMLTPTAMLTEMPQMDHSKMMGAMPTMRHDDPNSVLVKPGETRDLVWKFSSAKDLEFACNIPGHYESGMVGPINPGR